MLTSVLVLGSLIFSASYFGMALLQTAVPEVTSTGAEGQAALQTLLAIGISGIVQFIKKSTNPLLNWISEHKPLTVKLTSAISAFLVTAGIAISHSGTFDSPDGLTITVAGLSLSGLTTGLATFFSQWIAQHISYLAIWRKAGT